MNYICIKEYNKNDYSSKRYAASCNDMCSIKKDCIYKIYDFYANEISNKFYYTIIGYNGVYNRDNFYYSVPFENFGNHFITLADSRELRINSILND